MVSLTLNIHQKIDQGAFSDIFAATEYDRIYKLFISRQHRTVRQQGFAPPEEDVRRKNTFSSECDAYRILSSLPAIRGFAPRFDGPFTVEVVTGLDGTDVSQDYLLDCCYGMERISGRSAKLQQCLSQGCFKHLRDAVRNFASAGITYLRDANVFSPEDPDAFKLIDFAVREPDPPLF